MLPFKRIYKTSLGSGYCAKIETSIPENEGESSCEDLYRLAKETDEDLQIEALRGWYSWGF